MKFYFQLIFFSAFSFSLFAQNKQVVDSLHNLLTQTGSDTVRALTLAELSFQYRFFNPDSALLLSRQGLSLSRKLGFIKGEVQSLSNAGFMLRDLGNLPEAMKLQLEALKIAQANGFHLEAGLSMMRLATLYRDLADYQTSLQYLRNSFVSSAKANNIRGKVIGTMLLGQTFIEMDNVDSALFYESNAMEMILKMKQTDLYPYMFRAMGEIQKKLNNPQLALQYYRQAIESAKALKLGDYRTISTVYNNIASLYSERNQVDSAIYYAKMALENAGSISSIRGVSEAALMLSRIYEPIDTKQSYKYFRIASNARDSFLSRDKFLALQQLTFEKQEQDNRAELEKIAYRDRLKLYSLISGLTLILIVAIVLYRNNRQKQQANLLLQKTLKDLKSAQSQLIQAEKMASLGQLTAGIAHEIQNPLNFVNNFSEVNRELIKELNQEILNGNLTEIKLIANDLDGNEEKINHHGKRAEAIVKSMLQHSQSNSSQKEWTDINVLCDEYFRLAYHGQRSKNKDFNVNLRTDFDPNAGKLNVVPEEIGRVLFNLFNNAFYALEEKLKSDPSFLTMVSVSTFRQKEAVEIVVKDNGNGIPDKIVNKIFQPFFTTKPTGEGTGLGLSLSYDIIKAHGGDIKVISTEREGSEFLITLKANS